ncbi:response regulator [Flavobacteriaceae bacterium KMM 6897]|nr:response regulator [Flavobacteriaceae bacterium KMM 6897]MEB8344846.1 response regulator [Flavobacteriaceae bacterium KMM 6898]
MVSILIIDDCEAIRENTAELLELEGFQVITAANGKEGFEKVIQFSPDLVVCDILMPEMDGFEVLRKLGAHPEFKTIPVIFFTAKNEKKYIAKALESGAYDYIVKPSELNDLIASINRFILNRNLSFS